MSTTDNIILFCLADGEPTSNTFPVSVSSMETIGHLKNHVKYQKKPEFDDIAADRLTLWLVRNLENKPGSPITLDALEDKDELNNPRIPLSKFFHDSSPDDNTYIIVQRPPPAAPERVPSDISPPGTQLLDPEWKEAIAEIEKSFASEPKELEDLRQFITGAAKVPTGGSLGLPVVIARAGADDGRPSLLFLNLPESSEKQEPRSTADKALENLHKHTLPLSSMFGVSGCGKTRTAIEMLCKHWGFYFNGSATDHGSRDLSSFLEIIRRKRRYKTSDEDLNRRVHILALALLLSRIMVLERCLDISERDGATFTCKHWMLLQVCFHRMGFKDFYAILFEKIAEVIHNYSASTSIIGKMVRERLSGLRQRLLDLDFSTPFRSNEYKFLFIVDEAQLLGKDEFGAYRSGNATPTDEEQDLVQHHMRPVLSPLIHGFYEATYDKSTVCVVPCGTGLSIFDLRWLEDSAAGVKGYTPQLGPFTDFASWESLEQLRNYRELVRASLPNPDATAIFDSRVPDTVMPQLFSTLHGRFRPIVSAIERMLASDTVNNEPSWRWALTETEASLTSPAGQYFCRGNIVFDIMRMVARVASFPDRYRKYQSVRGTLQQFVTEYCLAGKPMLLDELQAPLVEASVGRIQRFGRNNVTILDEPFVLKAALNYFRFTDNDFHQAVCGLFTGTNPTDHGHKWEMAVLPALIHVFHNKKLSETALAPQFNRELLQATAKIVGIDSPRLGIVHGDMTLEEFLTAHIKCNSVHDGEQVPPFYRPSELPSGPDLVFVLRFEDRGQCPVFIQLKLRLSVRKSETLGAFKTVEAGTIQGHLLRTELQDFCTIAPKQYMAVVIAYPAELQGSSEWSLPLRRSQRIRDAQGDEAPQRIALKIDKTNIHNLFPKEHVRVLDILKDKGVKRASKEPKPEDVAQPPTKQRRYQ